MIDQSGVIKLIVFGALLFGIGIVVLNFMSYNQRQTDFVLTKKGETSASRQSVPVVLNENKIDYKSNIKLAHKTDYQSNTKPAQLTDDDSKIDISKISIRKYKISTENEKNKDIFVRETGKGRYHILLLHGQGSSSKIWEDIGTLQYLSKWGYHAFAIDIPHGESNSSLIKDDKEAIQRLTQIIYRLHLKNLVIISPSMSGRLTLPFIFQLNKKQKFIQGFVPIAPVGTDKFSADDYKMIKIPTLIVHGEKDIKFQSAFENLKNIPTSEILLIKDASHASYSEKPIEFHNALRQFLYNIYRPIYENRFKKVGKKTFASNTKKLKNQ